MIATLAILAGFAVIVTAYESRDEPHKKHKKKDEDSASSWDASPWSSPNVAFPTFGNPFDSFGSGSSPKKHKKGETWDPWVSPWTEASKKVNKHAADSWADAAKQQSDLAKQQSDASIAASYANPPVPISFPVPISTDWLASPQTSPEDQQKEEEEKEKEEKRERKRERKSKREKKRIDDSWSWAGNSRKKDDSPFIVHDIIVESNDVMGMAMAKDQVHESHKEGTAQKAESTQDSDEGEMTSAASMLLGAMSSLATAFGTMMMYFGKFMSTYIGWIAKHLFGLSNDQYETGVKKTTEMNNAMSPGPASPSPAKQSSRVGFLQVLPSEPKAIRNHVSSP